MPVGLQIVGGRFGEEKAVAVAKVIRELLDPSYRIPTCRLTT